MYDKLKDDTFYLQTVHPQFEMGLVALHPALLQLLCHIVPPLKKNKNNKVNKIKLGAWKFVNKKEKKKKQGF